MRHPSPKPTSRRSKGVDPAAGIDAESYSAFIGELKRKITEARQGYRPAGR
jgi:hypothetical protein